MATPEQPRILVDILHLPEGRVYLELPETMSQESVEVFEEWLYLTLRKVRRTVRAPG